MFTPTEMYDLLFTFFFFNLIADVSLHGRTASKAKVFAAF